MPARAPKPSDEGWRDGADAVGGDADADVDAAGVAEAERVDVGER